MADYTIVEDRDGFRPYGGARRAFESKHREVMLSGPAETGKTYSLLHKLHLLALGFPGSQLAIIRKTYKSAVSSVVQTYWDKVVGGEGKGVTRFGGERVDFFLYPNTSRIWVGGLDNPDKVLSSERDVILVNQAEELELGEWEYLITRCTGRAGTMPWSQLVGDCNPGPPHHWIRHRNTLEVFESRHRENPSLYDPLTGAITEQGKITMAILSSLTGIRRERLFLGRWVRAEGVIYSDWDESIHLIAENKVPELKRVTASVDWGFTRPGAMGIWGHDGDGRLYLIRQVYRTKRTSSWWVEQAVLANLWAKDRFGLWIERFACDPAEPDNIEDFNKARKNEGLVKKYGRRACRLKAKEAPNAVRAGIGKVQDRIKVRKDNKPRLYIVRDSLAEVDPALKSRRLPYATEQEILEYVWSNKSRKEEPIKENDHGMDMLRYEVSEEDGIGEGSSVGDVGLESINFESGIYEDEVEDMELLIYRTRERIFRRR